MTEKRDIPGVPTSAEQQKQELFYQRLAEWQGVIDGLGDPDQEIYGLRDQIKAELNHLCPYIGKPVYAAGRGIFPVTIDDETITDGHIDHSGTFTQHIGMTIVRTQSPEDRPVWRIMHRLDLGEAAVENGLITVTDVQRFRAYLETDAYIVPLGALTDIFKAHRPDSVALDEKLEIARAYSSDIHNLLCSTAFQALSQPQQIQALDRLVEKAEDSIRLRGLDLIFENSQGYVPVFRKGKMNLTLFELDELVSGVCLGLESIERFRLLERPLRRTSDRVDQHNGLFMVIDADQAVKQHYGIGEDDLFFIALTS